MKPPVIELIARGVLVWRGKVLLCKSLTGGHLFLPGGHVEFGEQAATALKREIHEELGVRLEVGRFLGGVEAAFDQPRKGRHRTGKGAPVATRRHHEINLVFELRPPRKSPPGRGSKPAGARGYEAFNPAALRSLERQIEFVWVPLADLPRRFHVERLYPRAMVRLLLARSAKRREIWMSDWN